MIKKDYKTEALLWAEKYGIIEYTVKGCRMIYYKTYPTEGTYKHIVDLRTLDEKVVELKRRRKVGKFNI